MEIEPDVNQTYRLMENGVILSCSRCNSTDVEFECRASDAVYLLSARRSAMTLYRDGVHFRNKIRFAIADVVSLEDLKSVSVKIQQ